MLLRTERLSEMDARTIDLSCRYSLRANS